MRKQLREQTVLFFSVAKWIGLATIVGIIVGLATSGFLKLLNLSTEFSSGYTYFYLLLPLAFAASTLLIKKLSPQAAGHGTEKVIEAIHTRSGRIDPSVVPVKVVATIVTLASGGSAGKEGPCAQIGGGLASLFADIFPFSDHDRKKLVICGISGGFAAVFGTPIAGAIFGVEVLFVGALLYDVLLPSFIAGITAYQISVLMGGSYFHNIIVFKPVFSEVFFLKVLLGGVFFGLCSFLLIEMLNAGEKISHSLKMRPLFKALLGGSAVAVLALIFSRQYLGLGLEGIEATLGGQAPPWYAFLLKPLFTSLTLNFGGSGGIVTPIFFIGSAAGSTYAHWIGADVATFAAIGFVAVLAGAANTPIAASIMAVEVFGPSLAPYATVACVVSYLMTGHRSVYPSQILSVKKSAFLDVELGAELGKTETDAKMPQWSMKKLFRFRRKEEDPDSL
jgi:H+/Cl- antiporter ClcA